MGLSLELLLILLSRVLVLDGLGAAVRVAVIVEEATEGELVEGVLRVLAVSEPGAQSVIVVAVVAPELVWVHGVEVGRVCTVGDLGHVRWWVWLLPHVHAKVNAPKKGVRFDLICPVLAQPVLGSTTQLHDQIGRLGAQLGLRGDVQRRLPVYHLRSETHIRMDFYQTVIILLTPVLIVR